ncbi:MAG: thioesterase family protein [Clostridia bacterium]|nr:thioesterase family protein [Clostridia bacterium]
MINIGSEFQLETIVTKEKTALNMKSGDVEVFATPSMIALMEETANNCLKEYISPEEISVGTMISTSHVKATPLDMKVRCVCKVTEVEGRMVTFDIKAYDEIGLIGEGSHQRCVLNREKFLNKVYNK